jgi:hypothetical protein
VFSIKCKEYSDNSSLTSSSSTNDAFGEPECIYEALDALNSVSMRMLVATLVLEYDKSNSDIDSAGCEMIDAAKRVVLGNKHWAKHYGINADESEP